VPFSLVSEYLDCRLMIRMVPYRRLGSFNLVFSVDHENRTHVHEFLASVTFREVH